LSFLYFVCALFWLKYKDQHNLGGGLPGVGGFFLADSLPLFAPGLAAVGDGDGDPLGEFVPGRLFADFDPV